MKLWSSGIN